MVQLSLFASHPQQGIPRLPQLLDCEPFLLGPGSSQYVRKPALLAMQPHDLRQIQPWKQSTSGLLNSNQFDSTIGRHVLSDVQDTHLNSIRFSAGIAKQCARQREILEFLRYVSSEVERGGLDMSLLTDLMGLEVTADEMFQHPLAPKNKFYFQDAVCQRNLLFPSSEIYSEKSLIDMAGDLDYKSELLVSFDGLVAGGRIKTMDLHSIIAELNLSKNSTKWRNQSMLVPQFDRLKSSDAIYGSLKVETTNVVPLKSPRKTRLRSSPNKKSNQKTGKKRELPRKSNFHSCEALLSIIFNKRRHEKTAILELKRSTPELTPLLTQLSATIAGTGIALVFSVLYKVASCSVPFCTSKLLNTALGLGLVWLSWAVNRMRDTIIHISRNSRKLVAKEEEALKNLDTSFKQVYRRAATLMVLMIIRLA
ncbi:hypothetical protein ACET3Z_012683 [Daucus carota]